MSQKIILYHGSNVEVKAPKIIYSKRLLDFGTGFYLTTDFEQAKKWAVRTTARREDGRPTVSVFEVYQYAFKTENALSVLKIKEVKSL